MGNPAANTVLRAPRRRKAFVSGPDAFLSVQDVFVNRLPEKFDPDAHRALFLLRIVAQLVSDHANEWLAPYGLTVVKYSYLIRLYVAPKRRLSLNELSRYVNTTNASVTTMINALESDGLVRRVANKDDGRSMLAELTARGAKVIAEAFPSHNGNINLCLAAMTKRERRQLWTLLHKVATGFEARKA